MLRPRSLELLLPLRHSCIVFIGVQGDAGVYPESMDSTRVMIGNGIDQFIWMTKSLFKNNLQA